MVNSALKRSTIKISVEIEKARPMLNSLFYLQADVVFVSKEYAQYSGLSTMEEAVKGFLPLTKPGWERTLTYTDFYITYSAIQFEFKLTFIFITGPLLFVLGEIKEQQLVKMVLSLPRRHRHQIKLWIH